MSTAIRITCSNGYTFFTNESTIPGQVRVLNELMPREQAVTMFKNFVQQGITYTKELLSFRDNPCTEYSESSASSWSWRDSDNASK